MNIFQLAVFSCVRLSSLTSEDILSMTCAWQLSSMYATEELCNAAAPKIGTPIFSDMIDGRKVEKVRCGVINVIDRLN